MRAFLRIVALAVVLIGLGAQPSAAQERYSSNEVLDAGHRFFGGVSRGLAQVIGSERGQRGLSWITAPLPRRAS